MPIVFNPPPGVNPIAPATFAAIPQASGVYIVGVKIIVTDCDGSCVSKFCPMYVGETKNLNKRIQEHHCLVGGYLNERKELFDFVNYPISVVYKDIQNWNLNHWNFYSRLPMSYPFATKRNVNKEGEKNNLYQSIAKMPGIINTLIYFNCSTFFDYCLNLSGTSNYMDNSWHSGAICDLTRIGTPPAIDLVNRIESVKNSITAKFYYAYAKESDWQDILPIPTRIQVETLTKCALEHKSIFTYGKVIKSLYKARHITTIPIIPVYSIDLSAIQTVLINLTGFLSTIPLVISV